MLARAIDQAGKSQTDKIIADESPQGMGVVLPTKMQQQIQKKNRLTPAVSQVMSNQQVTFEHRFGYPDSSHAAVEGLPGIEYGPGGRSAEFCRACSVVQLNCIATGGSRPQVSLVIGMVLPRREVPDFPQADADRVHRLG